MRIRMPLNVRDGLARKCIVVVCAVFAVSGREVAPQVDTAATCGIVCAAVTHGNLLVRVVLSAAKVAECTAAETAARGHAIQVLYALVPLTNGVAHISGLC